jgi:hypothetical protein
VETLARGRGYLLLIKSHGDGEGMNKRAGSTEGLALSSTEDGTLVEILHKTVVDS